MICQAELGGQGVPKPSLGTRGNKWIKMDTKRLEQIGKDFISSTLQDSGILVAEPRFDRLGTDLIGFTSVDDEGKFCRIQCKYRELKKSISIKIDSKYVVGAFVLFLYIKYAGKRHVFCFLPEDINRIFKHNAENSLYQLCITPKIMLSLDNYNSISFSDDKKASIYEVMNSSSPNSELKLLLPGIFKKIKKLNETKDKLIGLMQIQHKIEILKQKNQMLNEMIEMMEGHINFIENQQSSNN